MYSRFPRTSRSSQEGERASLSPSAGDSEPYTSSPLAVILLIGVNLIPLAGVLLFDWSLFSIMLLYWLENGIIGLFNVFKIALARAPAASGSLTPRLAGRLAARSGGGSPVAKGSMIAFFIAHYGIFWAVHGVFVFALFWPSDHSTSDSFGGVAVAAVALLISHGVSFVVNFLGRREYLSVSPAQQMSQPYSRVVVLHLTLLGGGFLVESLGAPFALLVFMVLLKTLVDLQAHLREHRTITIKFGMA